MVNAEHTSVLQAVQAHAGARVGDMAATLGLTGFAFGNAARPLVKAGYMEKATREDGASTYQLTAEGAALLAPKPKDPAPKLRSFVCVQALAVNGGRLVVSPTSAKLLEELGQREVALGDLVPHVVARAAAKLQALACGERVGVEVASAFFAQPAQA